MAVLSPPCSQQQLLEDMDELRVKHCKDDWKGRVLFQCFLSIMMLSRTKNLSLPPFQSDSSTSATLLAPSTKTRELPKPEECIVFTLIHPSVPIHLPLAKTLVRMNRSLR
jgi:hypothetical protein